MGSKLNYLKFDSASLLATEWVGASWSRDEK